MREERYLSQKLRNLLHTGALFGGLMALMMTVGGLIAGESGFIISVIFTLPLFFFMSQISGEWLFRIQGGRRLDFYEVPEVYRIVATLAQRAHIQRLPVLYIIPSSQMNAITVGTKNQAAIALTEPLLSTLDSRELAGVLAHEIAHIKNNDLKLMTIAHYMSRLTRFFSVFGQFLLFINFPLVLLGKINISWFGILLLIFAPMLSSLLQLAISRAREFDADLEAAQLTNDPEGLAIALKKIEQREMFSLWKVFFPYYKPKSSSIWQSHPDTEERIRRLMELRAGENILTSRFDPFSYSFLEL